MKASRPRTAGRSTSICPKWPSAGRSTRAHSSCKRTERRTSRSPRYSRDVGTFWLVVAAEVRYVGRAAAQALLGRADADAYADVLERAVEDVCLVPRAVHPAVDDRPRCRKRP